MKAKAEIALRDEAFMRQALLLARRGAGRTRPNPAVGAVIVKNGRVIAKGFHKKAGLPHAEIEAFKSARQRLDGATLYVTLEPCCHFGKTPPCTDAIIRSGVKRVVAGMRDPNRLVAGRGVRILRRAGIEVVTNVLKDECERLNEWYVKYITKRMPYVTLKLAMSLDGRIAAATGDSKWITGQASRRRVHRMRAQSDAVMVGVNTVLKDDPALTVRLVKGRDPLRVIVDSFLRTPLDAKVFNGGLKPGTVVFTTAAASRGKARKLRAKGIDVVVVPGSKGKVDIKKVLKELGLRGVCSLLVEGGGTLGASFIKAGLADRVCFFMAPIMLGADGVAGVGPLGIKKVSNAVEIKEMAIKRLGGDVLIQGRL